MPDFPQLYDLARCEIAGHASGTAYGTTVTSASAPQGGANSKGGPWSQLIAATVAPASAIALWVGRSGASTLRFFFDIGIGAAGFEQVLIENVMLQLSTSPFGFMYVPPIPVHVPAGSRLSARVQVHSGNSQTAVVAAALLAGGWGKSALLGRATTYGAELADTSGISVDPGGSANTKGAWAVLDASCRAIRHLTLMFGNQVNATPTSGTWRFDVGIGAAGLEQVIIPDLLFGIGSAGNSYAPYFIQLETHIPANSRLVVRSQSTITDATDRLIDVAAIGVE